MRTLCLASLALLCAGCGDDTAPPPATDEGDLGAPPAAAAEEPAPNFRYTRLTDCTLIESAAEEAGYFRHECAGEGGYRLQHIESDLRENLAVLAPDGAEHDLGLTVLSDGAFSSLGDTVEWRDDSPGGEFAPTALIVRQQVMEDPDPAVPEVSYLAVARLTPQPCVVARVSPGPDQNDRARAAADDPGPCLPAND